MAPVITPEHPASPEATALIAELDAHLTPLYPLFGTEYGEIKRMWVRPQFRGLGYGKLMLDHLAAYARTHDIATLRLETGIHQSAAIRLYEREGFKRIPPFGSYRNDPVSLCYEKRLE